MATDGIEITRHGNERARRIPRRGAGQRSRSARLTWVARGDARIADHTLVPPEIGGKGVAAALVEALIADAQERGLQDRARSAATSRRSSAAIPNGRSYWPTRRADLRQREFSRWCCWRGLNSRPHPYQGCALPLSYSSVPSMGFPCGGGPLTGAGAPYSAPFPCQAFPARASRVHDRPEAHPRGTARRQAAREPAAPQGAGPRAEIGRAAPRRRPTSQHRGRPLGAGVP